MKTRGLSRFFPTLLMSMMMGGKGAPLSESGSEVHYPVFATSKHCKVMA
jgi:hypothetical protein